MSVTQVKELAEIHAGMMDCKKALNETNGDMDAAVDWLRTRSGRSGRNLAVWPQKVWLQPAWPRSARWLS